MPLGWQQPCLKAVPSACAKAELPPPQPAASRESQSPWSHRPPSPAWGPQRVLGAETLVAALGDFLRGLWGGGWSEADVGQQRDQIKLWAPTVCQALLWVMQISQEQKHCLLGSAVPHVVGDTEQVLSSCF